MSNYLPPGCTDSMCDGIDETCASCGCNYSMHYETDEKELTPNPLTRDSDSYYGGVEYGADGVPVHSCDSLLSGLQCECTGFAEGEYDPHGDEY